MPDTPDVRAQLRAEFSDWRPWITRTIVIAYAVVAGLSVVFLTWLSEQAAHQFGRLYGAWWWAPLLWMPLCTAAIVWITRLWLPGAAGSGIPQVMAATDSSVTLAERSGFVSLRLSIGKIFLTSAGLLGGLSLGREGPAVQIAAGIMHHARRVLPERTTINEHGLLVAGGAAGIAAAFNTPLAGVMFAIEELSRRPEQRSSGLLIAAIVLAGLVSVAIYGNETYFGVIRVPELDWSLFWPGLSVALLCGVAGGLFSRLVLISITGGADRLSRLRKSRPVVFGAVCGFALAVIGVTLHGATFGSGYDQTRALLEGGNSAGPFYTPFKFIATWLSTWSGVPAGIFAPSLAIGAGIGNDVATLTGYLARTPLIALGMVGFLAAVTQAPLTAFIIVMEMIAGQQMVLSLMACALVASLVSRLISVPLYGALSRLQLRLLHGDKKEPSEEGSEQVASVRPD